MKEGHMVRFLSAPLFCLLACPLLIGQARAATCGSSTYYDPLAPGTLVVYASNDPDSVSVKDCYLQQRFDPNGPPAPVCPLTLPDITSASLSETDWNSAKTSIRNCLNTYGRTNILYIVLAYIRPYTISLPRGVGSYALDSYIADIWDQYTSQDLTVPGATHRYYASVQSQGSVYVPFVPFASYRAQPRSLLIYSVWRLDGANPQIAMNLIDAASQKMQSMNPASEWACVDRFQGPGAGPDLPLTDRLDAGYGQGEWDLHRAAQLLGQAGISVLEDANTQEFGTAPAPATCPVSGATPNQTAIYSGWYSLNNYNGAGVFNWATGSIGFHLDSNSATDPRGGPNWVANALLNGITVTAGAMAEPYLEGLPRPAGLFRNLLEGANVGDAFLRNTRWLKWRILNVGDPLYRPFPSSGIAPFNPPQPNDSLALASREIVGGTSTTGTVTLAAPAGPGGVNVALSVFYPTSPSTPAAVPPSVTVPQGAAKATFSVTTFTTTGYDSFFILADTGSAQLGNTLTRDPLLAVDLPGSPGLGLSQSTVTGGQAATATVYLNGPSPIGGITLNLSSSDTTAATVQPTLFIRAGIASATFTINTVGVTSNKTSLIQAAYNGAVASNTLTVTP
jgi:uncharacterized protein (TIGR03790 family)